VKKVEEDGGEGEEQEGPIASALLKNLVEANIQGEGDKRLTDGELLSNIFIFLLAGHETTAHTLSFAIILLSLHPEIQRTMYEEVCSVWPNGCPASSNYKEDYPKLKYTLAVFHETLRLFPSVTRIPKQVTSDTSLPARRFSPGSAAEIALGVSTPFQVAVPKGSVVVLDIIGTHTNPLHWGADAHEFKPERFIDTESYRWPRDAFYAFSAGQRACIGQYFAVAEGVCILANLVQHYEVLLPTPANAKVQKMTESERRDWMLEWSQAITMAPVRDLIRLRRRDI